MGLFKRLFGICKTLKPADESCWQYRDGKIIIDLSLVPELKQAGDALRIEGRGLPHRLLVFIDSEGKHKALKNRCTHMGRRLDPIENGRRIQCCSVNKSTFGLDGSSVSGPGKKPLDFFSVTLKEQSLVVEL